MGGFADSRVLIGLMFDLREPAVPSWISDWLIVAGILIFSVAHAFNRGSRYMRLKELLAERAPSGRPGGTGGTESTGP